MRPGAAAVTDTSVLVERDRVRDVDERSRGGGRVMGIDAEDDQTVGAMLDGRPAEPGPVSAARLADPSARARGRQRAGDHELSGAGVEIKLPQSNSSPEQLLDAAQLDMEAY